MADGRWQMADGRWQMADGRWQMADESFLTFAFAMQDALSIVLGLVPPCFLSE
jgi:hypothetical protein